MKKINVAQRPTSFNQPFLGTHRSKIIRQSNAYTFFNDYEFPIIGSNFLFEDNKILKTPTTPQFPMPDTQKPFINEILQGEFEIYNFDKKAFDQGSEDFPWTPDTPSSDSKDPLMTDAVNIECSNGFSSKITPIYDMEMTQSYQRFNQSETLYSSRSVCQNHYNDFFADPPTVKISADIIVQQKKPFTNLPFDISSFTLSTNASMIPNSNKKRPRLHLLQFIYCLLNSTRPTQCVCWVDKDECIFKIINPNKLTNLWGRYKQNPNMSFDSLSRSLRLYYASGRLERVTGQRNQYRFVNREESIDFNRRNKRKSQQYSLDSGSSKAANNIFRMSKVSGQIALVTQSSVINDDKYYGNHSLTSQSISRSLI